MEKMRFERDLEKGTGFGWTERGRKGLGLKKECYVNRHEITKTQ